VVRRKGSQRQPTCSAYQVATGAQHSCWEEWRSKRHQRKLQPAVAAHLLAEPVLAAALVQAAAIHDVAGAHECAARRPLAHPRDARARGAVGRVAKLAEHPAGEGRGGGHSRCGRGRGGNYSVGDGVRARHRDFVTGDAGTGGERQGAHFTRRGLRSTTNNETNTLGAESKHEGAQHGTRGYGCGTRRRTKRSRASRSRSAATAPT
jgi:hypothetical protein